MIGLVLFICSVCNGSTTLYFLFGAHHARISYISSTWTLTEKVNELDFFHNIYVFHFICSIYSTSSFGLVMKCHIVIAALLLVILQGIQFVVILLFSIRHVQKAELGYWWLFIIEKNFWIFFPPQLMHCFVQNAIAGYLKTTVTRIRIWYLVKVTLKYVCFIARLKCTCDSVYQGAVTKTLKKDVQSGVGPVKSALRPRRMLCLNYDPNYMKL